MNIFKKKKTPDVELPPDTVIQDAYDNIEDLKTQIMPTTFRDRHGEISYSFRNHNHNEKIKRKIKHEEKRMELAEERKSNPQQMQQRTYVDKRKKTTFNFSPTLNVGSGNKTGLVDSFNGSGNDNGNRYDKKSSAKQPSVSEPAKNSKVKTIFAVIGIAVLIGALAFGAVYLGNCINEKSDAYSTAAAIFASTSE